MTIIEKELDEKYLMFMFFPNKTRQRGVIQQDAKDKGVEGIQTLRLYVSQSLGIK